HRRPADRRRGHHRRRGRVGTVARKGRHRSDACRAVLGGRTRAPGLPRALPERVHLPLRPTELEVAAPLDVRGVRLVAPTTEIRPFRVEVPQQGLDGLHRRIDATRWPTPELVDDRSQGVQLAAIQALARYWTTDYDWRRCEARLNALPQFKTEIDG